MGCVGGIGRCLYLLFGGALLQELLERLVQGGVDDVLLHAHLVLPCDAFQCTQGVVTYFEGDRCGAAHSGGFQRVVLFCRSLGLARSGGLAVVASHEAKRGLLPFPYPADGHLFPLVVHEAHLRKEFFGDEVETDVVDPRCHDGLEAGLVYPDGEVGDGADAVGPAVVGEVGGQAGCADAHDGGVEVGPVAGVVVVDRELVDRYLMVDEQNVGGYGLFGCLFGGFSSAAADGCAVRCLDAEA